MPSSNKTLHLSLNKWLGSDKPKKDDFNADNQKVDDACRELSASLSQHAGTLTQLQSAQQTIQQNATALDGRVTTNANSISAHTASTAVHITDVERTLWNKAGEFTMGSYTGNGTGKQKVTLGFQPKFGLVYAVGAPPSRASFSMSTHDMYLGLFSKLGCSDGLSLEADGFSVLHNATSAPDGLNLRYNVSGGTYVYVAWK